MHITRKTLPKVAGLPGAVCEQWRRCGTPSCHCMRGGPQHGPYNVRIWYERGRMRKQYVKRADVEDVRLACDARRAIRQAERQELAASWVLLRRLRAHLREVEQMYREH